MNIEKKILSNFGYIETVLPKKLYNNLLNECLSANKKNKKMVSGLTKDSISGVIDENVADHFYIEKNEKELTNFVFEIKNEYDKVFPGLGDIKVLTRNANFVCSKHWTNIQKKGEFLPNHTHDGIYSYTIWIKIPKLKTGHFSGDFEFVYNNITGKICTQLINLTNIDEGKIIMFPAKLPHCVYPFYDTDELRISISGNILLEN